MFIPPDIDGGCCLRYKPPTLWQRFKRLVRNIFHPIKWWKARRRRIEFTKFIVPRINRVYPALIANQLIEVQPMTAPTGELFDIDYQYETTKEKK